MRAPLTGRRLCHPNRPHQQWASVRTCLPCVPYRLLHFVPVPWVGCKKQQRQYRKLSGVNEGVCTSMGGGAVTKTGLPRSVPSRVVAVPPRLVALDGSEIWKWLFELPW